MPSDLTGRAVYVVSSGLQMDPQLHGTVQTNPVKLFSNIENARVYARNLAKELFWDNMKNGCPHEDDNGYTTPTDDDFSCDGDFDEQGNADYIEFSYKSYDRRSDEENDSGYVSVDVMYIDEEVEDQTKDTNDNKKRKLDDNNEPRSNDPQPASSMPLLPKSTPPLSIALPPPPPFPSHLTTSTPHTSPMPHDPRLSSTNSTNSTPYTAPMLNGQRYTYYNQPQHVTFPNQPNYSTTRMIGSYGQYDGNVYGHPAPPASYNQPTFNVPNSYSNPIVVPDSPKMSSSSPNIMAYQPLAQNGYSMPCPFPAPAIATPIKLKQYIPSGPSMAHNPSKPPKQ